MKKTLFNAILGLTLILGTACGPVKIPKLKSIGPNETAWVIPLDTATSAQAKFNSVEYLNQKKVAAKRVTIDAVERSTGRMWFDYEWIDAVRVITVDRSLVTREWTDNHNTGTSAAKQGIPVNTKDNIGLTIGLTITVSIDEEDASTYLYYHGEKPLAAVTDENIRSYAVAELNKAVSSLELTEFQQHQAKIYNDLFTNAVAVFKEKGVKIQYLGNAEGWHFSNQSIQESINKSFIAQQDNKTAEMEQVATKTRNATLVLNAQAQVEAAEKLLKAKEASELQNDLAIRRMSAETGLKMAEKWDGRLPANILPSNSPLLMNLGNTSTNR
jgi:hypothetical protein